VGHGGERRVFVEEGGEGRFELPYDTVVDGFRRAGHVVVASVVGRAIAAAVIAAEEAIPFIAHDDALGSEDGIDGGLLGSVTTATTADHEP